MYSSQMKKHQTDSKFIKHIPCENCGSKDNNSMYDDGHQYCFGCSTYTPATNFPPDIDRFLFRKARWSDDVNKFLTRELEVQYPTWFEPHGQAIESMPLIGE